MSDACRAKRRERNATESSVRVGDVLPGNPVSLRPGRLISRTPLLLTFRSRRFAAAHVARELEIAHDPADVKRRCHADELRQRVGRVHRQCDPRSDGVREIDRVAPAVVDADVDGNFVELRERFPAAKAHDLRGRR